MTRSSGSRHASPVCAIYPSQAGFADGGIVVVNGPTGNGNGVIDVNGTFDITRRRAPDHRQRGHGRGPGIVRRPGRLSYTFESVQSAGTVVHVVSATGERLATFTAPKDIQSVVYSSPEVNTGETYGIQVGGTASGMSTGGLHTDGDPCRRHTERRRHRRPAQREPGLRDGRRSGTARPTGRIPITRPSVARRPQLEQQGRRATGVDQLHLTVRPAWPSSPPPS